MTDMIASDLAHILDTLRTQNAQRDWSALWEEEEQFAQFEDALDDLIQFSALVSPGANLQDTQLFVGKLTIGKVQLENALEQENESEFVTLCTSLSRDVNDMLLRSPLVKNVYTTLKNSKESIATFLAEDADKTFAESVLFILSALPILVEDEGCCDDEECEDSE
jgi:hypothetical protein